MINLFFSRWSILFTSKQRIIVIASPGKISVQNIVNAIENSSARRFHGTLNQGVQLIAILKYLIFNKSPDKKKFNFSHKISSI